MYKATYSQDGIIVVVMSCVPLSVPVSIYLMWSRYFRNQLNNALIFAGLPVYVFIVMLLFTRMSAQFENIK